MEVAAAGPLQPGKLGTLLDARERNSWLRSHEIPGLTRFESDKRRDACFWLDTVIEKRRFRLHRCTSSRRRRSDSRVIQNRQRPLAFRRNEAIQIISAAEAADCGLGSNLKHLRYHFFEFADPSLPRESICFLRCRWASEIDRLLILSKSQR